MKINLICFFKLVYTVEERLEIILIHESWNHNFANETNLLCVSQRKFIKLQNKQKPHRFSSKDVTLDIYIGAFRRIFTLSSPVLSTNCYSCAVRYRRHFRWVSLGRFWIPVGSNQILLQIWLSPCYEWFSEIFNVWLVRLISLYPLHRCFFVTTTNTKLTLSCGIGDRV